jgi:hypothetical protein
VHDERFGRVANTHSLALAVDHDLAGHFEVGRSVDINVTIPGEVLDDRHLGLGGHSADEPLAAARDRQVDILGHRKKLADGRPVRSAHELHRALRQPNLVGRFGHQVHNRLAGMHRFLAATQDDRIA